MNGYKANAVKRTNLKNSLLAAIIYHMGAFDLSYLELSELTGIAYHSIRKGLQKPEHITIERLESIMNAVLSYVESKEKEINNEK